MKKILTYISCIIAVSLCTFSYSLKAQTVPEKILLKGKIIDAKDKSAIIGASVIEQDNDKRTLSGVATDIDGNFALPIKSVSNKITISYIGYKTQIFTIGTRRVFNVSLVSNNTLGVVDITAQKKVDNGTGLSIDVRDQTSATASINAKDLEELQATSIDQALQGRLPGVDIVASSGDPGAGMAIRIRGTSSINGVTNPLIVVDGMPYETTVPTDFNFQTADEQGYASLLSIAPSDIKDITVLKDAAATAVWGSRAANGVLIINTKRGSVSPPVFTLTTKLSFQLQPSNIPLLNGNQYSELIPELYINGAPAGLPLPISSSSPSQNLPPSSTGSFIVYKEFEHDPANPYYYYNYGQNTDWVKAVSQTGYTADNNISLQGGGERARYFASLGYTHQIGTTIFTGLDRLNTRINLDYVVSDKIRFKTDVAYSHEITQSNYANVRGIAQVKMPNMSIYEYDEYGNKTPNYFTPARNVQGLYPGTYNPVAVAALGSAFRYGDRVTPHFSLNYQIIPGLLTAIADVQFDISTYKQTSFLPQSATGRPNTETVANRVFASDNDSFDVYTKTNFSFTPNIGEKQSFIASLQIQTDDRKSVGQSALTSNTATTILQDPSAPSRTQGTGLGVGSSASEFRNIAGLFQGQYKLLDRYILAVSLRGEGNSRFGPNNRYGMFPSISGRYRMSGEPFMKRLTFLNDLSIRASYGVIGNAPGSDYSFYNNYTNYGYTYLGQAGVYPSNIQLDNLRWEKVTEKNLGFNLILFNQRVNFDAEIYRHTTSDLFFPNLSIASFSGYSNVNLNVGTLDNQGLEISLLTTPLKSRNWIIDFSFNIAHNENVIRQISPFVAVTTGNYTLPGQFLSTIQINNPLGSFYGFMYDGVYKDANATIATDKNGNQIKGPNGQPVQMRFNYPVTDYLFQPGDAKYKDINNDGVIDARDIVYLGNGNPKFTGGFGPTITFKRNWKFTTFFSFRYGFSLINNTMLTTTDLNSFDNQSTAVLRRWQKPGDVTDIPRALFGKTNYNSLASSHYVQDGSYMKFTAATIRYNFKDTFVKKLKMKNISTYVTSQNILTLTKYIGQDPEVSPRASDIYQQPIDNSLTPPSRQFILGLTATF